MKLQFITVVVIGSLNIVACGDDANTGTPSASGGMGASAGSPGAGGSSGAGGAMPSAGGVANPGSGGAALSTGGKAADTGGGSNAGGTSGAPGSGGAATGGGGANTAGSGGAAGASGASGAAGAAGGSAGSGGSGSVDFKLTSSVVADGQMIPKDYRCQNPSPPLSWTAGPSNTKSYAIVFKDVTRPQSIVMHWVIYDIPSAEMSLPMNVPSGAMPASPAGAKQGPNYSRQPVYAGPCAPSGTNTYKFTLYAIDAATLPDVPANPTATQIETALEGTHKLATATLGITSTP